MVRLCRRCSQEKAPDDFYASNQAACKACVRAAVTRRRLQKLDEIRAYDRARSKLPHRLANASRVSVAWRRRHRDRMAAHNAAHRARLPKPDTCLGCGQPKRLEKHHHDYARPLAVVWLCKPCHALADKIRRAMEVSA
jgi:hypothetical protein